MKKAHVALIGLGLLLVSHPLFSTLRSNAVVESRTVLLDIDTLGLDVKQMALAVLKSKCNVCHKKRNPFKVFSLKNMDKNAAKIYQQVFVYKRMPKGDQISLTEEEYQILKNWITSTNNIKNGIIN